LLIMTGYMHERCGHCGRFSDLLLIVKDV